LDWARRRHRLCGFDWRRSVVADRSAQARSAAFWGHGRGTRFCPFPLAGLSAAPGIDLRKLAQFIDFKPRPESAPTIPAPGVKRILKNPPNANIARTYVLPSLTVSNSLAVKVAAATATPYQVVLRVLGPPGEWAVFSFDSPNELNGPPVANHQRLPIGNTLAVPAGQFQILSLRPYQTIYAKGSIGPDVLDSKNRPRPPVCVSVTQTESSV
jgi:hypothetical protein